MNWWKGFINKFLIRLFDIIFSIAGLIILSPFIIIISLAIVLDSRGGIIFSQLRVGRNNEDFRLLKFRTMHLNADRLGLITVGKKDSRITRTGSILRRYKLDEIPQLVNVIFGQMSMVGPRPEVRKYTVYYSAAQQMIIHSVRPGITDMASIEFSRENELLQTAVDPEKFYIEVILPAKLRLNMLFIENYTFNNYIHIIFRTIRKLVTH